MTRYLFAICSIAPAIGVGEVRATELPIADSFCYPVGSCSDPSSEYYNAQDFLWNNHLGEDWNGLGGSSTDFADPVFSIGRGFVKYAEDAGGSWGYVVIIRHLLANGSTVNSAYGHLAEIFVWPGQTVDKGEIIGSIGDANGWYANTAHLHFEVRLDPSLETVPGTGYSSNAKVRAKYTDPSEFIDQHPTISYVYDDNLHTCLGPIVGGAETGWVYTCGDKKETFYAGQTAYALIRLDKVFLDHKYRVEAYKDSVFQWEWSPGWFSVEGAWEHSHFWPALSNGTPGWWQFRIYLELANTSEILLDTAAFTILPYAYDGNITVCNGPVSGGSATDWYYTCQNPASLFKENQTVYGVIRTMQVSANHRYRVRAWKNGAYQWEWAAPWITVAPWVWKYSHFFPTLSNSTPGAWKFSVDIDIGKGWNFLDEIWFTVK